MNSLQPSVPRIVRALGALVTATLILAVPAAAAGTLVLVYTRNFLTTTYEIKLF